MANRDYVGYAVVLNTSNTRLDGMIYHIHPCRVDIGVLP